VKQHSAPPSRQPLLASLAVYGAHILSCSHPSLTPWFLQISNTYKPDFLTRQLGQLLAGTSGGASGGASSGTSGGASGGAGSGVGWGPLPYPGQSPWAWEVTGQLMASLAAQALLYGCAVLLVEAGVLPRAWRRVRAAWEARAVGGGGGGYRSLPGEPALGGD
jgi:hypothetical protein